MQVVGTEQARCDAPTTNSDQLHHALRLGVDLLWQSHGEDPSSAGHPMVSPIRPFAASIAARGLDH